MTLPCGCQRPIAPPPPDIETLARQAEEAGERAREFFDQHPGPIPRTWYVPPEQDRSRLPVVDMADGEACLVEDPEHPNVWCYRVASHGGRHLSLGFRPAAARYAAANESYARVEFCVVAVWPQEAPDA